MLLKRFFAFFFINSASCARILAIMQTPSYSHQIVARPIWRELSLRGHQVTLMTCNPINDPTLSNLTEIDMHAAYDIWEKVNITEMMNNNTNVITLIETLSETFQEIAEYELSIPEVQEIINGPEDQFDLVMVEFYQAAVLAFRHKFNVPLIWITTLEAFSVAHESIGNPVHPVLYPEIMLPFIYPLSFAERLISVLFLLMYTWFVCPRNNNNANIMVEKHFGEGYPNVRELFENVDLLLVNANHALQPVRPTAPATVYIGGGIHLDKPKDLSKDIQTFLDDATEGVVYFSLGSNVKSKDIPDKTRQTLLDTFRDLPYKVLWKFEGEMLEGKPDNVKIMKWIPQQDVLRHKNIKVFITQGGLQSTEEALFNHVPLVVMPFFGDQEMNAKRVELKGFGITVHHKTLDKVQFTGTLLEVIKNPKYRDTAKELAKLALDEPMTGLEKAIWWTEYVLRHKGAKHLKGPAVNLPLYQYFFLDIVAFVLAILATLIVVVVFFIKFIKRLIFGRGRGKFEKKVKSL